MASTRASVNVPLASRGARLGASFVDLFAYLGWLFVFTDVLFIFRSDRRCIHDLIAGTQVITGQPEGTASRGP